MLQKTQKQSPFLGLWPILSSSSPPSINTPPNQKNTGADLKQLQKVCICGGGETEVSVWRGVGNILQAALMAVPKTQLFKKQP